MSHSAARHDVDAELVNEFKGDIDNLVELKSDNNWGDIRSADGNFISTTREYSFGKRVVFEPIGDIKNLNLQSTRGIGIPDGCTVDDIVNNVNSSMAIEESDQVRIDEIEKISQLLNNGNKPAPNMFLHGFCEIGFRIPKLMHFYSKNYDMHPFGYEYNPLNVKIAQKMGYEAIHMNLMDPTAVISAIGNASLTVCYHVLEHVSRPQDVLKLIHDHMSVGSYLHIEVPIEPGIPRLEFGHLFPFDFRDLEHMGKAVGFRLITLSNETHHGGPVIERYMMFKAGE